LSLFFHDERMKLKIAFFLSNGSLHSVDNCLCRSKVVLWSMVCQLKKDGKMLHKLHFYIPKC
jgi:hypothetical protein